MGAIVKYRSVREGDPVWKSTEVLFDKSADTNMLINEQLFLILIQNTVHSSLQCPYFTYI